LPPLFCQGLIAYLPPEPAKEQAMIELHSWPTPNGMKVSIFLEEAGLEHTVFPVSIRKGEQFAPEFLAFSPNNRIPAIRDLAPAGGRAPIGVFESGAILVYLAEKTGQFYGGDLRSRTTVLQWLMWQMGGLGPMLGQNGHFNIYATEKIPYAMERYVAESRRLYGVLDKQLAGRDYIADDYSIADMACYPWVIPHEAHQIGLENFPNVLAWFERVKARPAVAKAYAEKDALYPVDDTPMTDAEKLKLFGIKPKD
jgi:GSH-dependent disulfide-bond oxidoreductase